MADVPVLVCVDGDLKGQRYEVPEGGLNLGRAPENHVVIADDGVSRFHARVLFDNGALWLRDAGSRNGVFVNNARVTQHHALKVGDEIRVAKHRFVIRLDAESQLPDDKGAKASGNRAPTASDEAPRPAGRRWFWPFS